MSRERMERTTIRLTVGQLDEIEAAVERGEYPNNSEAIRAAIREKFQEEDPSPSQVFIESQNGNREHVEVGR